MPDVLGGRMSLPVRTKIHVTCPRCFRVVQITAAQYTDKNGEVYVEAPVVWQAMSIHVRYGCVARRRAR
jgi:hypothetical protein